MNAVDVGLACVKRDGVRCCTRPPIVRYRVGPVCSEHQLFGAEVLEWLGWTPDAEVDLAAAMAGPTTPAQTAILDALGLPDPARPAASAHVDAAPGEANAARLVAYKAGKIRARVLEHLTDAGQRGTTAIEAWRWYQATYSPTVERYSVAPRLSEMVADGWATKTGATRSVRGPGYPPEEVYVLSARGRREKGLSW